MEKVRITMTLDKSTIELLDKLAEKKGLKRSTFLNLYLKENLKDDSKKKLI